MATTVRNTGRRLTDRLRSDCTRFEFDQLVRLMLIEARQLHGSASVDRSLRFCADLSAGFPAHEVTHARDIEHPSVAPVEIATSNFVLAGTLGALPEPYTDWLRNRVRDGDRAMADFLDVFNNRLNALRFMVRAEYHPALLQLNPEDAPLGGYLASAGGLATAMPSGLPRRAWTTVAGLLANPRRSAVVIERVLSHFLGAKVALQPLRGRYRFLGVQAQTRLGSRTHRLGRGANLGTKAWDAAAAIQLDIGPLTMARYLELLPPLLPRTTPASDARVDEPEPGTSTRMTHKVLRSTIPALVDRSIDSHFHLILRADAKRPDKLSGMRLGYTTWLQGAGAVRSQSLKGARFLVAGLEPRPQPQGAGA